MTRISASVLFTPFSKLYILTELSANDVKLTSSDRQELDLSKYISYGTVNSIFVEIQPDSTNIKNDPRNFLTDILDLVYLRFTCNVQRVHLSTEEPAASRMLKQFGKVGGDRPEYFSSLTHFAKIEDKKVIAKN